MIPSQPETAAAATRARRVLAGHQRHPACAGRNREFARVERRRDPGLDEEVGEDRRAGEAVTETRFGQQRLGVAMDGRVVEARVRRRVDDAGVDDVVDARVDGGGDDVLVVAPHRLDDAVAGDEHECVDAGEGRSQGRRIVVVGEASRRTRRVRHGMRPACERDNRRRVRASEQVTHHPRSDSS